MSVLNKLSNFQMYRLRKMLKDNDRDLAVKYLQSFNGKRDRSKQWEFRNYRAEFNSDTTNEKSQLETAKQRLRSKSNLTRTHLPAFPSKVKRYFGVEIECFVPTDYVEGGTYEDDCPECDGSGEVSGDCHRCDGSGHVECWSCDGSGEVECPSCDGSGKTHDDEGNEINCSTCDGDGKTDCSSCDGSGEVECPSCDGSGQESMECGRCDGIGTITRGSDEDSFERLVEYLQDEGVTFAHVHGDGSLSTEDSDYTGVEISILVDQKNPENLRRLTKALESIDARVNKTCGLHVHLDFRHCEPFKRFSRPENQRPWLDFQHRVQMISATMEVLRYSVAKSRLSNTFCQQGYSWTDKYREVNASTFDRTGTIEVRLHSGTTNFEKIWNWCQVLHAIAYGEIRPWDGINDFRFNSVQDLERRFNLSPSLVSYLRQRIEFFHGPDHEALKVDSGETVQTLFKVEGNEIPFNSEAI